MSKFFFFPQIVHCVRKRFAWHSWSMMWLNIMSCRNDRFSFSKIVNTDFSIWKKSHSIKLFLKNSHDIDNTWYSSTRWYFTTFFFDTSWKHIFSFLARISASFFYQKSWFEAFSFCLQLQLFYNISKNRRNFQYVFLVFSKGIVLYHSLSLIHLIVSDLLPHST